MKFNILKILLYIVSFSFVPLMFDVATITNLRRPEIILPIVISAGLLVVYCIIVCIIVCVICISKRGLEYIIKTKKLYD